MNFVFCFSSGLLLGYLIRWAYTKYAAQAEAELAKEETAVKNEVSGGLSAAADDVKKAL